MNSLGPVHRGVDRVARLGEGALQAGRPRVEPADVLPVEAEDGRLVLGAGGEPVLLVLPDRPAHLGRLGRQQFLAVPGPPGHAGRASAQDQALQRRPAVQRVLQGQHAAPGTAEQVQAVEPESGPDLGQLLDEPLHRPQRRIVGAVGAPAAELVVEDHPAPAGQGFQGLQVVVGEAGPAVQAQQRRPALAHRAVPDPPARDLDGPLVRRHTWSSGDGPSATVACPAAAVARVKLRG